jgi:DNA-binding response OmpR family regulator
LRIVETLRSQGNKTPVLFLTALGAVDERVKGLKAGGDDYLVKPFEMDELEARVRALARRQPRPLRRQITMGALALDLDAREVTAQGKALALPRREVSLLEVLITAQGRTISKNDLIDHIYGTGADVEEGAIEVHISRLRKRLKPYGMAIRVARGLGYALLAEGPRP